MSRRELRAGFAGSAAVFTLWMWTGIGSITSSSASVTGSFSGGSSQLTISPVLWVGMWLSGAFTLAAVLIPIPLQPKPPAIRQYVAAIAGGFLALNAATIMRPFLERSRAAALETKLLLSGGGGGSYSYRTIESTGGGTVTVPTESSIIFYALLVAAILAIGYLWLAPHRRLEQRSS